MSDQRPRHDVPCGIPDLRVGDAQQHAIGSLRTSLATAERAGDLETGVAQGGCERRAHPARAHDHAVAGERGHLPISVPLPCGVPGADGWLGGPREGAAAAWNITPQGGGLAPEAAEVRSY